MKKKKIFTDLKIVISSFLELLNRPYILRRAATL